MDIEEIKELINTKQFTQLKKELKEMKSADISSIRVASEMCLTMHDELMAEVDKISKEIKGQEKSKVIEILKESEK